MGLLTRRAKKPLPDVSQDLPEPPRHGDGNGAGAASPLASPRRPFAPRSGTQSAQSSPRTKQHPTLRHTGSLTSLYQGSPVSSSSCDSGAATVASTHLPSPRDPFSRRVSNRQNSQPATPTSSSSAPPSRRAVTTVVIEEEGPRNAPSTATAIYDTSPRTLSVYETQPTSAAGAGSPHGLVRKKSSASLLYQGLGRSLSRMGTAMRRKASVDILDMSSNGGASGHSSRHPSGNGRSQLNCLPEKEEELSATPIAQQHATTPPAPVPILKPTPVVPPADESSDPDVSRPFNVHHDLHVSAGLQGLPPEWLDALKKQGVTEHDLLLITSAQQRQRAVAVTPLGRQLIKKIPPIDVSGRPKTPDTASHAHSPAKAESITLPSPQSKKGTYRSTPPHPPRARTTSAPATASPLATPTAASRPAAQGESPPPLPSRELPTVPSKPLPVPLAKADTPSKVPQPAAKVAKAVKPGNEASRPLPDAPARTLPEPPTRTLPETPARTLPEPPSREPETSDALPPAVLRKRDTLRALPTPPVKDAPVVISSTPPRNASRKAVPPRTPATARPLPTPPPAPAPALPPLPSQQPHALPRVPPPRLPSPPPASLPPAPSTVPSAPSSARAPSPSTTFPPTTPCPSTIHSRNTSVASTRLSPVPSVPPLPPLPTTSPPDAGSDAPPKTPTSAANLRRSESLLGRLLKDLDSRSARPSRPVDEAQLSPPYEPDDDDGSSSTPLDDGQPLEDDDASNVELEVEVPVSSEPRACSPPPPPPSPPRMADVPVSPTKTIDTPAKPKSKPLVPEEKVVNKVDKVDKVDKVGKVELPKLDKMPKIEKMDKEPKAPKTPKSATRFSTERRRLDSFKIPTDDPAPSPGLLSIPSTSHGHRRLSEELRQFNAFQIPAEDGWAADIFAAWDSDISLAPFDALQPPPSAHSARRTETTDPSAPPSPMPAPGNRASMGKRRSLSSLRMSTDFEDISSMYLRRRSRSIDFNLVVRSTVYSSVEAVSTTAVSAKDDDDAAAHADVDTDEVKRSSHVRVSMSWGSCDSLGVAFNKNAGGTKVAGTGHKYTNTRLAYLELDGATQLFSRDTSGSPLNVLGPPFDGGATVGRQPPPPPLRVLRGREKHARGGASSADTTSSSDAPLTPDSDTARGALGLSLAPGASAGGDEYARSVASTCTTLSARSSTSRSRHSGVVSGTKCGGSQSLTSSPAAADGACLLDADGGGSVSPLSRMSSIASSLRSYNVTEATVQRAYTRVLRRVPEREGSDDAETRADERASVSVAEETAAALAVVVISAADARVAAAHDGPESPNSPDAPDTPTSPPAARPESALVIAPLPSPAPHSACDTPATGATAFSWKTAHQGSPAPPTRNPATPLSPTTPTGHSWKTPRNSMPSGVLSVEDSAWLVALHEGRV